MNNDDKKRLLQNRERAIGSMMSSDRANTQFEGALQALGYWEESGQLDLKTRLQATIVKVAARAAGWNSQDIDRSIEIGKQTARLEKETKTTSRN